MELGRGEFRVGDWWVQPSFNRISRGSTQVHLRPKLMDILLLLARHAGEVVSSDEIVAAVWARAYLAESVVTRSIAELREALGDRAAQPLYIETITKRGYRLVARVDGEERTTPVRGIARARPWAWAIAGGALAIPAIVGAFLWQHRGAAAHLDPGLAVVAVFENRTGDPALDPVGWTAAEEVSQDLRDTGAVRVVPRSILTLVQHPHDRSPSPGEDPRPALARATGAGIVVSGWYSPARDKVVVRAEVYDATADAVVYEIEPTTTPRERVADGLEAARQRIADAVAARYLDSAFDLLAWESKPPKWEAYREFRAGRELMGVDHRAMVDALERSMKLDPGFVMPLIYLTGACFLQGSYEEAAGYLERLEANRARLTPIYRHMLDSRRAMLGGRWEESLVAMQDAGRLAPSSAFFAYQIGLGAVYANHLHEAVAALASPLDWTSFVVRDHKWGVWYFERLTAALHMLGDYERELTEARRGIAIYREEPYLVACEVRALAALGRKEEMEREVEASLVLPWRFEVPGRAMIEAALELRAHGNAEASLAAANAAVKWLRSLPAAEAKTNGVLRGLAYSLLLAGRWTEARAAFADLAARDPRDLEALGRLGRIAACLGDRVEATRISEELRSVDRPFLFGENTYQRACIAAQLEEKEAAIALLREALSQGKMYGLYLHRDIDLEPLRGDPHFEELVKPKD